MMMDFRNVNENLIINAAFGSSKSVVDKDANTKKKNKSNDRSSASTAPLNKGLILQVTKSLNTFNILHGISFLLILSL